MLYLSSAPLTNFQDEIPGGHLYSEVEIMIEYGP